MMRLSSDITQWPAHALARSISEGRSSPRELVAAHAARIEAVNPSINAIVQSAVERALEEAERLQQTSTEPASSSKLRGLPFTVKDNFETEGIITAIGVVERAGVVPKKDASLVRHVRDLGALLIGKTNCPPWGAGLYTDNEVYGRTNNPYDLTRTSGGSSGGEAAAVASGMSPLGFGTDSGGSVRIPAHFCGIAAILPTARLLPTWGVIDDDGSVGTISDPRTRVGILARTVEDLSLALTEITPVATLDEATVPLTLGNTSGIDLSALRIALQPDNGIATPTTDTIATVEGAGRALEEGGAAIEETELPSAEGQALTEQVWRSYDGGMPSRELYALQRRWDSFRHQVMMLFRRFDAIVCPVFDRPAPRHGVVDRESRGISYATPYSLTDSPSVVVRCGTSSEGLPLGIQVIAAPWHDDTALAVAAFLEEAFGGWSPPPDLAVS